MCMICVRHRAAEAQDLMIQQLITICQNNGQLSMSCFLTFAFVLSDSVRDAALVGRAAVAGAEAARARFCATIGPSHYTLS